MLRLGVGSTTIPCNVAFSIIEMHVRSAIVHEHDCALTLWFVGFNFGHIQLLMFVIVKFRSYSFGHQTNLKQKNNEPYLLKYKTIIVQTISFDHRSNH